MDLVKKYVEIVLDVITELEKIKAFMDEIKEIEKAIFEENKDKEGDSND